MYILQIDLEVFQSDPLMPNVWRPDHLTPGFRQRHGVADQDQQEEELSDSDADDRVTLVDRLKGKTGGAESSTREESPDDVGTSSCPKKPRT